MNKVCTYPRLAWIPPFVAGFALSMITGIGTLLVVESSHAPAVHPDRRGEGVEIPLPVPIEPAPRKKIDRKVMPDFLPTGRVRLEYDRVVSTRLYGVLEAPGFRASLAEKARKAKKPPFSEYVRDAARHTGLRETLILAVIRAESGFRPRVVSHAGAVGLMQLKPEDGGRDAYEYLYQHSRTPHPSQLFDPEFNIWLGAAYLKLLIHKHFGTVENPRVREGLALAAYNWGPGNVRRKIIRSGVPVTLDELHDRLARLAPAETARYVARVMRFEQDIRRSATAAAPRPGQAGENA